LAFPVSNALMIPVAFGAVAGLYFFFRGFWLLQHKAHALGDSAPKTQPAITTLTTTFMTEGSDTLARASNSEVIRLTPDGESTGGAPVTQQGRIAAALLKAGISNLASWSTTDDPFQGAVGVADPPAKNGSRSISALQALDLNAFKTLKQAGGHPALRIRTAAPHSAGPSFGWKPALMVWGGPVLTLACLYILAAHFGWL
jgi:hypothetical protein